MTKTASIIQNRIHILTVRNPIMNQNIIRKLKRQLRKLEKVSE